MNDHQPAPPNLASSDWASREEIASEVGRLREELAEVAGSLRERGVALERLRSSDEPDGAALVAASDELATMRKELTRLSDAIEHQAIVVSDLYGLVAMLHQRLLG